MKQTALYPGNEDHVEYWITDPILMAQLQAEFQFDTDACPFPRPAGYDGLKEPWGKRTWVNPPFTQFAPWVRKALQEREKGNTSVLIFPVPRFISTLLEAKAETRVLGPVQWYHPNGTSKLVTLPHVLFILRPKEPRSEDSNP